MENEQAEDDGSDFASSGEEDGPDPDDSPAPYDDESDVDAAFVDEE